jgi:hypothetical protein
VRDAGRLYETTAGYDRKDATSLENPGALDAKIWEKKDLR